MQHPGSSDVICQIVNDYNSPSNVDVAPVNLMQGCPACRPPQLRSQTFPSSLVMWFFMESDVAPLPLESVMITRCCCCFCCCSCPSPPPFLSGCCCHSPPPFPIAFILSLVLSSTSMTFLLASSLSMPPCSTRHHAWRCG